MIVDADGRPLFRGSLQRGTTFLTMSPDERAAWLVQARRRTANRKLKEEEQAKKRRRRRSTLDKKRQG